MARLLLAGLVFVAPSGCGDAVGPGASHEPRLILEVTPATALSQSNTMLTYHIGVFNSTPHTIRVSRVESFLHNPATGEGHGGSNPDLNIQIAPYTWWGTTQGVGTLPDWSEGIWIATAKVVTQSQYLQTTREIVIQR